MNKYHVKAPIIIIGMHRSGTTMIASMLRQLGLFIGDDLEENSESMFFIRHNDWIFDQCGGSWDNPSSIKWLLKNQEILNLTDEYIRARLAGFPSQRYLGWKRFISGQNLLNRMGTEQWGWKDPRTTYSLPIWLRIFPDARVINIFRNGVAVAASLRARERRNLKVAKSNHSKRKRYNVYSLMAKRAGFIWSPRCLSLSDSFSLWEEYVETSMLAMERVGTNGLSVKYEDFLDNPIVELRKLSQFCNLQASEAQIREVASRVKKERADAHSNDEELSLFSQNVKLNPTMARLGYP